MLTSVGVEKILGIDHSYSISHRIYWPNVFYSIDIHKVLINEVMDKDYVVLDFISVINYRIVVVFTRHADDYKIGQN